MASKKKREIIGASITLLILILGTVAHELWFCIGLRDRPWQFESYADNLSARCATNAGAYAFAEQLHALAGQVEDAKLCLSTEDKAWVMRRDYASCYQKLAGCTLTAFQIRQNQEQRAGDQKARFNNALRVLESELDGDARAKKAGTKFEIRNLAQSQARTQIEIARNLIALGQTESALIAIMRARAAWIRAKPPSRKNWRVSMIWGIGRNGKKPRKICCAGPGGRLARQFLWTSWSIAACCWLADASRGLILPTSAGIGID